MTTKQLLSQECKAVADGLRNVRTRLYQLLQDGQWPENSFADISTVVTDGLLVAEALDRLASNEPTERTPTHLDERR